MVPTLKKKCVKFLFLAGIIIIGLVISISFSRFSDSDEGTGGSIISYMGQSMLVFNGGIATCSDNTMNGRYFFYHIFKQPRDIIWKDSLLHSKTDNGAALNTFVGCSWLDFGPIVTIIIAIFVCLVLRLVIDKYKKHKFAILYLYTFYINYLFLGVFHSTIGYSRNILMGIFMFIILVHLNKFKSKPPMKYVYQSL